MTKLHDARTERLRFASFEQYLPGTSFTDIDMMTELHSRFLFCEWKRPGQILDPNKGQGLCLRNMVDTLGVTLVVINGVVAPDEGNPDPRAVQVWPGDFPLTPEMWTWVGGQASRAERHESLGQLFRKWASWAGRQSVPIRRHA